MSVYGKRALRYPADDTGAERLSDVQFRPPDKWQYMPCIWCDSRTVPYGGFGDAPEWNRVGKYWCRKCDVVWSANPITGVLYERSWRGRPVPVGPGNVA